MPNTAAGEGGVEPQAIPRSVTLAKVLAQYAAAIGRQVRLVKRKGRMEVVVESPKEPLTSDPPPA